MITEYKKILLFISILFGISSTAFAYESLLYYELQAVGGYNISTGKNIWYSSSQNDVMQKPGIGFDYIGRISGKFADKAGIFLQARLAYNDGSSPEGQLYNAYINIKSNGNNFWLGHNRPSFGLSSVFDTHALILPGLTTYGFGFDRDWGAGINRDTQWGNLAFSFTSGSGMPLYTDGNYLLSMRIAKGVLNRDNYDIGISLAKGNIIDIMGYHKMSDEPVPFSAVNIDYTFLWNQYSVRTEYLVGSRDENNIQALFLRFGINVLNEDRGLIEIQPTYIKNGNSEGLYRAVGFSYQLTGIHTLRLMYHYDPITHDETVVMQWYIYGRI